MKKKIIFVIILTALSLAACNNNSSIKLTDTDNNQSRLTDIFEHNHSVSLFQFGLIMDSLSKVKNDEDVIYVSGMVDLYLSNNPSFIPAVISSEKESFNKMVQPELQEPLLNLYSNQKKYIIENIKPLLEKRNLEKIQYKKMEFEKLYSYERDLNDYRWSNKDNLESYKETLASMNKILSK